ncbi:endonuclease domain-containing protein [Microbacterium sp. 179-I 3D2 NHS]|uniref:endonuclease domain-containing protein n=1 Tax=Microbacterium sp. 179-I 3D2 NHS TaxID=3235178 RepID=UPI0039A049C9
MFALPFADAGVVRAAQHGGALTCAAALRAHGVWVLPETDGRVHVWLGRSGRSHEHPECSCTTHYSPGSAGLGLAPVAVCLIHAYRCLGEEAFFAAYESAWNRRLIGAHDRARIRRELPRAAGWLLDLARPDAQSGLESLLRLRLHLLGIRLECQVALPGVGRVDFVVGGRVILEADGEENHGRGRRHADLRRDAAASALGYETLRFDYSMIVHDWATVVAAILPAIGRSRS